MQMNCCKLLIVIILLQLFIFSLILYSLLNEIDLLTKELRKPDDSCHAKFDFFQPNNNVQKNKIESRNLLNLKNGSGVVCHGKTKAERVCRFQNLCYHSRSEKYLFFHGSWSFMRGLPENRFDPALLDLTSVDDHNTQYFNFVDFPTEAIDKEFEGIQFIESPSLLCNRFNQENLMHVIHDDILPLFVTLKSFLPTNFVNTTSFNPQLIFMDGRKEGAWFDFYQHFTNQPILMKKNLTAELTCFHEVFIGLSKDTTWYQYGFKTPQGPINHNIPKKSHIELFINFMKHKLDCPVTNSEYLILVSRKQTRIITNLVQVSISLANLFKKEVIFLDLETQSTNEAICLISNAVAMVGMHGAELILSLFLPIRSYLIELFPYGVNPDHYTPYKTLASIMNLRYIAWENEDARNTKTYPDRPSQFGGIHHLPEKIQKEILESEEVPRHLCCDNPNWLFRIYQDTFIDIPLFEEKVKHLLQTSPSQHCEDLESKKNILVPDTVLSITCLVRENQNNTVSLRIKWQPPLNAKYLSKDLMYQLIIQERNSNEAFVVKEIKGTETDVVRDKHASFNLWMRCKAESNFGPISGSIKCREG